LTSGLCLITSPVNFIWNRKYCAPKIIVIGLICLKPYCAMNDIIYVYKAVIYVY